MYFPRFLRQWHSCQNRWYSIHFIIKCGIGLCEIFVRIITCCSGVVRNLFLREYIAAGFVLFMCTYNALRHYEWISDSSRSGAILNLSFTQSTINQWSCHINGIGNIIPLSELKIVKLTLNMLNKLLFSHKSRSTLLFLLLQYTFNTSSRLSPR